MALDRIAQYEIVSRLGAGAYGTVYYAVDTLLTRPVVIKLLDRGSGSEDVLRSRMLEEARIASAIEHPNVCAIYEIGEYDHLPYIVMQYVPGQTLEHIIRQGPLNVHFALSIGIQIADGLAAAHRLGILHRDLKPSNVMLTEDGVVKILDFGLARRSAPAPDPDAAGAQEAVESAVSDRFGTTLYMAPEQFVLRRSSEQSDIFSLGVILYQMLTGQHPFAIRTMDPARVPSLIQSHQPARPAALRPEIPQPLEDIVLRALAKQPASRFRYALELGDALKALMRSLYQETGLIPGERSAVLPTPAPVAKKRPGLISGLVERIRTGAPARAESRTIAILPFRDPEDSADSRLYGFGLSHAVATRLSRVPSVVVRPLSAFLSVSDHVLDPIEAGRRLQAERVLLGSFTRTSDGLVLHWQLLDVDSQAVVSGGTVAAPPLDLAVLQNRAAEEIYSDLLTSGVLMEVSAPSSGTMLEELPDEVREEYLEARALLAGFASRSTHRDDLEQVRRKYERVLEQAPEFAPAHAGLGSVYLRSARNGFGGVDHLMAARQHLSRALELDPGLLEAKLYRASTLLWEGEKESARLDIQYLLNAAPGDAEVHLAAGVVLQLDGLLDEALRVQSAALRLNPAVATRVYYYRSRILIFQRRMDLARQEINRGLALAPDHTLLRNVLGYWFYYQHDLDSATATLEAVLADDPNLRIAYPTLAMCYASAGRRGEASALITEETLAAAAADAETAYRLATYYAVAGEAAEALAWLRKAIYRGNENYPWFASNAAWAPLADDEEYRKILADLEQVHRLSRARWERVLAGLPV